MNGDKTEAYSIASMKRFMKKVPDFGTETFLKKEDMKAVGRIFAESKDIYSQWFVIEKLRISGDLRCYYSEKTENKTEEKFVFVDSSDFKDLLKIGVRVYIQTFTNPIKLVPDAKVRFFLEEI